MTEILVCRTPILGTDTVVYSAWEPTGSALTAQHGTIRSRRDLDETATGWLGRIGTKQLPAQDNALPVGPSRSAAVRHWYATEYDRAYAEILRCYPHLASDATRMDSGEIEERVA